MKTKIQSFFAALFLLTGAVSAQYCAPTFNTGCLFGDQIDNFYTTGGASPIWLVVVRPEATIILVP
jgi:hypothetical protein